MEKINFFELAFFARHFNMDVNRLSWCILEIQRDGFVEYLLGIRQDGSKIVISVEECCLRRLKRGRIVAHEALLTKKNKSCFSLKTAKLINGQKREILFTRRNLEDLYRDKWYDESLEPVNSRSSH